MQHFLLSSKAHTLSLKAVFRMGEDEAYRTFCEMRWPENDGEAIARLRCEYCWDGETIVLVGGFNGSWGEDDGEYLIRDAVVLAVA